MALVRFYFSPYTCGDWSYSRNGEVDSFKEFGRAILSILPLFGLIVFFFYFTHLLITSHFFLINKNIYYIASCVCYYASPRLLMMHVGEREGMTTVDE